MEGKEDQGIATNTVIAAEEGGVGMACLGFRGGYISPHVPTFPIFQPMIHLWPWPVFPSSATTTMKMTTTIKTTKTKTTEELAATASALGKEAEDIADLIALLTRDLSLRQAVAVEVENVSVDQEE